MIKGVHAMFYSSDAEATRAFIRDTLEFDWADVGEGWLIFDAPEAEVGCHPVAGGGEGVPAGTHAISFYCDDLETTVETLKGRGVEFTQPITDAGFGFITHFRMPGGVIAEIYQPKYRKEFQRRGED